MMNESMFQQLEICQRQRDAALAREQALQQRLNVADQLISDLTAKHQGEPAAYLYTCTFDKYQEPVVRHSQLRMTHPSKGWIEEPLYRLVARPVDPERERLMEIVEQYPNGDPLKYNAAVRKLQQ